MEERGVLVVFMDVDYHKPGQSSTIWTKRVTLVTERLVTTSEAHKAFEEWRQANPGGCVHATFTIQF